MVIGWRKRLFGQLGVKRQPQHLTQAAEHPSKVVLGKQLRSRTAMCAQVQRGQPPRTDFSPRNCRRPEPRVIIFDETKRLTTR